MDPTVSTQLHEVEALGRALLADSAGEWATERRRALLQATRKLHIALQTPGEIVDEYLFAPADASFIKLGVDLNVFATLSQSEKPLTAADLAQKSGADAVFLSRVMRGLASINAVEEHADGTYGPSKIAKAFATVKGVSGAGLFHDLCYPVFQQVPSFFAETKYQNLTNPLYTPFNQAFTEKPFFEWVPQQQKILENFNKFMTEHRVGHLHWLDFYPVDKELGAGFHQNDPDAVMVVDVGGSVGHELSAIKRSYPSLPGRLVLQDLPNTITMVAGAKDFEPLVHDFFTPQPIKGARAYYLRNILHDWDDDKCRIILKNLRDAMERGYSKLLINEFCIPEQGASVLATHSDLMVMAMAAAVERTEPQWRTLLESAGLKIDKIWTKDAEAESIIEATPQ